LTKLLVKKYQDVLAGKGKIYCEQLIKSSEQIATLVEQINVYISTEEHPVTIEKFNPKKILQIVRGEHESQLTDRGVKLLVPEHLSEIRADRLCILRVFGNFIDNALKYGGDKLSEIKIAYEETEKFHIFSVTNDGVGLEQKDCSRIFGLFKRENRAKNVEGTGLGLAIVKKIAELHNGKVWGESPNKKGVAFYFSISKFL
jgi:light-regulated signal transduction histidine kinase (bacteriophytochrome)